MVTIAADKLRDLVRDIFISAGCSRAESERLAKSLVSANLAAHDSHGVVRVPRYLEWKADGTFVADQTVKVLRDTPVLAVVDGQYGFGQTVAPQAVEIGIEKCKTMGLS
ncbi:MAG TPA: Ldh family oxidoreductase, partial [Hyphomicrobiaceae bacterium]|nr:Ldh family oxidoreductase [Hyphomicrobiaceae bacterium]